MGCITRTFTLKIAARKTPLQLHRRNEVCLDDL